MRMDTPTTITFLGTGGGRHITASQLLQTGGFVIQADDKQIVCDPGPGHLVHARRNCISPKETDIVFVSHQHVDHSNDFSALIDAITEGKKYTRGTFICASDVRESELNPFHQSAGERFIACDTIDTFTSGNLLFSFFPLNHPGNCYGFTLTTPHGIIGYIADTEYTPALSEPVEGCDVLIINMTAPHSERFPGHLNTSDVINLISQLDTKPQHIILTHRGIRLADDDICSQELDLLTQKLGLEVSFAQDNAVYDYKTLQWIENPKKSLK